MGGEELAITHSGYRMGSAQEKACSHSRQFELVLSDSEVQMTFPFWHEDFGSLENAGAK